MTALSVRLGFSARDALCAAFDQARDSIDAEFYSIDDPTLIESLNRAADRGVRVHITLEGDTRRFGHRDVGEPSDADVRGDLSDRIDVTVSRVPHALVHGKAAVVDQSVAFVATANATTSGFAAPGEVLVIDRETADVDAVESRIHDATRGAAQHSSVRRRLAALFDSASNLRIASENLSDYRVASSLIARARRGYYDRILLDAKVSKRCAAVVARLRAAGVEVRQVRAGYMHEKFIDDGGHIYVGSANLTGNGLDVGYEIGVVARASDFAGDAALLRADFDAMWDAAMPCEAPRLAQARSEQ